MAQKKAAGIVGVLVLLFVILGAGYYFTQQPEMTDDVSLEPIAEEIEEQAEVIDDTRVRGRDVDASELAASEADETIAIDVEAALTERVLGNPDAPIKISEHSSLSCGHCGNFHRNVFEEFKANWIDTGRAYLVYSDFPLNAPALRATMAARCVQDDEQYFALLEELFDKQNDWAYESDFLTPLKAIVSKYGVDNAQFKACISNQELEAGLLDRIRAAQQQFNVNSTPSFVVNNSVTISGGRSYEEFNANLEAALAQQESTDAGEDAP